MQTLQERLEALMAELGWEHSDLVRASKQSSSVVSQWLGKGSKTIKTIGKMEAAFNIEAETGYSALWLAKGIGPKRVQVRDIPMTDLQLREPLGMYGMYGAEEVLRGMQQLLQALQPDMRPAFADVLAGWARDGGAADRIPSLMALISASSKVPRAA